MSQENSLPPPPPEEKHHWWQKLKPKPASYHISETEEVKAQRKEGERQERRVEKVQEHRLQKIREKEERKVLIEARHEGRMEEMRVRGRREGASQAQPRSVKIRRAIKATGLNPRPINLLGEGSSRSSRPFNLFGAPHKKHDPSEHILKNIIVVNQGKRKKKGSKQERRARHQWAPF